MDMVCQQITANGILVWFVFGLIMSLGWHLVSFPFKRWA